MTCTDFCTADKCAELEARIGRLEQALELLESAFEAHTIQAIPEAHNFNFVPQVKVNSVIEDGNLLIDVFVSGGHDFAEITLPSLIPELEVAFDIIAEDKLNYLFQLTLNDLTVENRLTLPEPDILDITVGLSTKNEIEVSLQLGDQLVSDSVALPNSTSDDDDDDDDDNADADAKSKLEISGSYHNNILTINITHGESSDSAKIFIDTSSNSGGGGGGGNQHVVSSLNGQATYDEEENLLTISIADGESSTSFTVEIETMDDETKKTIQKIYQILGGDNWQDATNGTVTLPVEPEKLIKNVGNLLYQKDSNTLKRLTVTNILELFTAFSTVDFYRSGHHRLPATVLSSLRNTEKGNQSTTIYDSLSYQEWVASQLDELIGEFPLKIKYQTIDNNGESQETEMCLENISEAMAEFMALTLNIAQDSDTAINIGMKGLVESMKASNAAISTYDYAVANAKYLGYKGNDKEREIDLTFTPGASNMREALQPSIKKIIGWENEDNETLVELIKKTLISTEIVKASLFHPFQPDDKVTGDAIREDLDEQKTEMEAKWEQFKQRVSNPTGKYVIPKPKAKIKDLTVDEPLEL